MTRQKFGRTWWGERWLDAFIGIDYSNRLPRGRSYAKPHRVSDLTIEKGRIHAPVQGREYEPYQVKISIKQFTKTQREQLIDATIGTPYIIGQLLNGKLPAKILQVAQDCDIELLPTDWKSIKAQCSCPDWAVPCKHIAAVIYLLSLEIDKNPFLIFELHGMDLVGAIQDKVGIGIDHNDLPISPLALLEKPKTTEANDEPIPHIKLEDFDLSQIPDLSETTFELLESEPLFHPGEFREILENHCRRVAKTVFKSDDASVDEEVQICDFKATNIILDSFGKFIDSRDLSNKVQQKSLGDWLDALSLLRPRGPISASEHDANAKFWYLLYRFAIRLLTHCAYIPNVVAYPNGEAEVTWRPSQLEPSINRLLEELYRCCPRDLVQIKPAGNRKTDLVSQKNQVDAVLNLILGFFIEFATLGTTTSFARDEIQQWFFTPSRHRFDWFGETETPHLVQRWLNCLTLRDRDHRILFLIDIVESELTLEEDDELAAKGIRTDSEISLAINIESDLKLYSLREFVDLSQGIAGSAAILSDLAFLSFYLPALAEFLSRPYDKSLLPITYPLAEFSSIFQDVLPTLRMLGVQLVMPTELRSLLRRRVTVKSQSTPSSGMTSFLDLKNLTNFDAEIAIGDTTLTKSEFKALVKSTKGLVQIKGGFFLLNDQEASNLLKSLEQAEALTSQQIIQASLTGELDQVGLELDNSLQNLLNNAIQQKEVDLPTDLDAELRPYQQSGFEWLVNNVKFGFGALLADDMGLGKTIQVISLVLHLKQFEELNKACALVVAPTSLLTNWRREIEKFAPTLSAATYHGPNREIKEMKADVILTSYGTVRGDVEKLKKLNIRLLVIDEAQNIKNPGSQQTKAIKRLRSESRIALSGTPVENRLLDYWSILDFAMPGYLGNKTSFQRDLARPIERERDQKCLDKFRNLTRPFILRRLKTDKSIIDDLPAKIEADRYCALVPTQAAMYENVINELMPGIEESESLIGRQGAVLKLLTSLKQICNSPSHYLQHARAAPEESGKLSLFTEIVREAFDNDEKLIVFTQFAEMGKLLVDCIDNEFKFKPTFLYGGLSRKARDTVVDAFQNESNHRAMILSLKAGGTGLNLTAANQVVHFDLWWNPAVEAQATDRAYRIGQTNSVLVHRLITENTFEEKINLMIQSKKELADQTVATGESSIANMSNDEIHDLVALNR